jgi:hypothetical protein
MSRWHREGSDSRRSTTSCRSTARPTSWRRCGRRSRRRRSSSSRWDTTHRSTRIGSHPAVWDSRRSPSSCRSNARPAASLQSPGRCRPRNSSSHSDTTHRENHPGLCQVGWDSGRSPSSCRSSAQPRTRIQKRSRPRNSSSTSRTQGRRGPPARSRRDRSVSASTRPTNRSRSNAVPTVSPSHVAEATGPEGMCCQPRDNSSCSHTPPRSAHPPAVGGRLDCSRTTTADWRSWAERRRSPSQQSGRPKQQR